jgi:heat shock protein HtpX
MSMAELPRNIYEQQAANRRNTLVVMMLFALFLGFLGLGFDVFFLGFGSGGVGFPLGTIVALIIGAWSADWSLQSGASTVLSSSGAIPVPDNDPKYQVLRNVVEEMSIASGSPKPSLYVIPDPDPNAFATGKDPDHACIVVTEGLLEKLDREELQGVIAHEMSHVRNYDIRMMTVVAALVGSVMLLSEFGLRSGRLGIGRRRGSSNRGGGGAIVFILWIIALILAPLISQILAMAVSRQREYLADASGAELTRNPRALASALQKIDSAVEPTRSIKKGTAHLCIADPLGRNINGKEGFFAEIFGTHPPIAKRIMLLHAMAYQHA